MNIGLGTNPFVTGTIAVLASTWLSGRVAGMLGKALHWIKSRLLYTVEIDNTDPAFTWLKPFVAERSKARYMSASAVFPENVQPGQRRVPKFVLCPLGLCLVKFEGRRMLVWLTKREVEHVLANRETITLQCLRGDKELFQRLLQAAYDAVNNAAEPSVSIWTPQCGCGWAIADRKPLRGMDTLVLEGDLAERIVADAREFLSSRQWYLDLGVPWRRGYLLSGPPGNGKSSLVHALASELRADINVLNLSNVSDQWLAEVLHAVPKGNIVLLEDIDAAWDKRDSKLNGLTMSGMLNALDGIASQEGRILVMTTNYPERLDPALVRPGRADLHIVLGDATADMAARMFRRFHPDASGSECELFGQIMAGKSMAKIQERLLEHRDDRGAVLCSPIPDGTPASQITVAA